MTLQQLALWMLLDDGGQSLARWLIAVACAVVVLLLVVVGTPVMVLVALRDNGPRAVGIGVPPPPAAVHPGSSAALSPVSPPSNPPIPRDGTAAAVAVARRYLGVPYVFGGSNPAVGLDCSGLVQLVFHQLGVALPRTAQQQFNATSHVPRDQLQPGDLVFFARTYADPNDWITHVGIYIGGGLQINAPTEGQMVSIQPVFSGFWGAHYASAGRVRGA